MRSVFLYLSGTIVQAYLENISPSEANRISRIYPGETAYLQDTVVPERAESERDFVLKFDGESLFYAPNSLESAPYQPTNAEVAQMISDLQVDLILAGVI